VSSVELLVFPRLYKETVALWQSGQAIVVEGTLSEKDQDIKVLANQVAVLDSNEPQQSIDDFKRKILEFREKNGGGFSRRRFNGNNNAPSYSNHANEIVKQAVAAKAAEPEDKPLRLVFEEALDENRLNNLRTILIAHPGTSTTYFKIDQDGKKAIIKTGFKVDNSDSLARALLAEFSGAVKIV
jgi:hypothetical protein